MKQSIRGQKKMSFKPEKGQAVERLYIEKNKRIVTVEFSYKQLYFVLRCYGLHT